MTGASVKCTKRLMLVPRLVSAMLWERKEEGVRLCC